MKVRAYLLMIATVALWGATFVVVKAALADATPGAFNLVRMTLAFAVLAVVYRKSWRQINRRQLRDGAIVGLCLAIGYQFQTIGLVRTTPAKSAFITGLLVVMVPFFSLIPGLHPAGAPRPRWNAFTGALLAFAGILLLTTPAGAGLLPDFSAINLGDVLTFGCAIGFTLHCIALAHIAPRVGFRPLALLQIGFCALFMLVSLPLVEQPQMHWSPRLIAALLVTAILATAAAFWVQSVLPPTHTALILTLEPAFAWLTSFLLLGERLGSRSVAGAGLILSGILLTELVRPRPSAAEKAARAQRKAEPERLTT
jgi:drug/metabolite transporter (DMT)-like permease